MISNHTANISWHPPATLLDDNTTYSLIIRNLTKSYSGTAINEWALHLSEVFNVTEAALGKRPRDQSYYSYKSIISFQNPISRMKSVWWSLQTILVKGTS